MTQLASLSVILTRKPGIFPLLPVRQVAQALQSKGGKKLVRGHEGIGGTTFRAARAGRNQCLRVQSANQLAADLFAKNVFEPLARNRLMIGDGGKDRDVECTQL